MEGLKELIQGLIEGEVVDDQSALKTYSRDAGVFEVKPALIIYPKTAKDLQELVRFAGSHKLPKVSLTARAAGTDMSGGPLNESLILDFTRYFNHIVKVGDDCAVTQPGVYYRDFEKETLKSNLIMPSYPASKNLCAVGGMVANNAGGEKSLSYGKTERYVAKLKVILRDGNEYLLEPLSGAVLERKLAQTDFEGQIYRKIHKLVTNNHPLIQSAKPDVSKNSTGYLLWNIWDGKTFDLNQLFVGSQGTLGLITEITFRLVKPKKYSSLVIISLRDLNQLADIVTQLLTYKPESFESYDDHTLRLALRFLPDMAKVAKSKSFWRFAEGFWPELKALVSGRMPKLTLIAAFTADSKREAKEKAWEAFLGLKRLGVASRVTETEEEAAKYWTIRRESFNLLRQHVTHKHAAPFIDDIIVKPEFLPDFLPQLNKIMGQYDLTYTLAGHIGDGNFHIFPLMDMRKPASRQIIPELSKRVFELVFRYKGSMSGEHNDGIVRTPFLEEMYGKEVYSLFKQVKEIFDPEDIFNPGKKVGITLKYAKNHLLED